MSNFPAGLGRDIRLAGASGASTEGWTYDAAYPEITGPTTLWIWLIRYWLKGELPVGVRTYCNVTVPDSSVYLVCLAAASRMSVPVTDDDTADTLSNRCIDVAGGEWVTPDP
jgi:hypothetical protein